MLFSFVIRSTVLSLALLIVLNSVLIKPEKSIKQTKQKMQ